MCETLLSHPTYANAICNRIKLDFRSYQLTRSIKFVNFICIHFTDVCLLSHDLCYAFIHKKLFFWRFFSQQVIERQSRLERSKKLPLKIPISNLRASICCDYLTIHQSPPNNTLHRNIISQHIQRVIMMV
jgi:hypothetical protein